MIKYSISKSLFIFPNGSTRGGMPFTYSGAGACKNDPSKTNVKDAGPLPTGLYRMLAAPDDVCRRLGRDSIVLVPDDSANMLGRSSFMVHGGDGKGTASEGCIVTLPAIRADILESGETELQVVK
jgi:hypothetical protein